LSKFYIAVVLRLGFSADEHQKLQKSPAILQAMPRKPNLWVKIVTTRKEHVR
jgi:hypothetical protein